MERLIRSLVRHRKLVIITFLLIVVLAVWALPRVQVNYNLQDYLPEDTASSKANRIMEDEFNMTIPNARIMVPASGVQEGLQWKARIAAVPGVSRVLWLDDSLDVAEPLELAPKNVIQAFLDKGYALFQVSCKTENAAQLVERFYALGDQVNVAGQLVDQANAQIAVKSEIFKVTAIVLPFVLVVLLLSTSAWLDPLAFLVAVGTGILLNMGSNIFLGSISFITQSVAAVLQLAVSMDYAIFLLNRFKQNRSEGMSAEEAMVQALRKSVTAISSSALTTFFGFLTLLFMRFGIGSDLGVVMAKGIVMSFLSVMIFMPVFILLIYRFIEKTEHRSFLPSFAVLGKIGLKARWGIVLAALILVLPAFKASRQNDFLYGMGNYPEGSKAALHLLNINTHFEPHTQMALMLPNNSQSAALKLENELKLLPEVVQVTSYSSAVDKAIPKKIVGKDAIAMLESEHYSQLILTAKVSSEGESAFNLATKVRELGQKYFPDQYHLTGANVVMLDMKDTIQADDIIVNGLAILSIAIVIMLAFKSLSIPVILVGTIELAIWLNLSFPYLFSFQLSYIGYLIISTVQLGATVDYAILYTEHYLDNRGRMGKRASILACSRNNIPSILPPALILIFAGFSLKLASSLSIVSELGEVLARGALLSLLLVIFLLPGLLYFMDPLLPRSSLGLRFFTEGSTQTHKKKEQYAGTKAPVETTESEHKTVGMH